MSRRRHHVIERLAIACVLGGVGGAASLSFGSRVEAAAISSGDVLISGVGNNSIFMNYITDFPASPATQASGFAQSIQQFTDGLGRGQRCCQSDSGGMAFDSFGDVFLADSSAQVVYKFDANANPVGQFGPSFAPNYFPVAILFDRYGFAYVAAEKGDLGFGGCTGGVFDTGEILKLDPAGDVLATYSLQLPCWFKPTNFQLATVSMEPPELGMDLAADQHTLFYVDDDGCSVHRFDLTTGVQLPNFNRGPLPGCAPTDVKILPDAGVLVADSGDTYGVERLDRYGNYLVQTYPAPANTVAPENGNYCTSELAQRSVSYLALDTSGSGFYEANLSGCVAHVLLNGTLVQRWIDCCFDPIEGSVPMDGMVVKPTTGSLPRTCLPTCFNAIPIPLALQTLDSSPEGSGCGPDGRLWFTEEGANRIGAVGSNGVVSEYSLAPRKGTNPEDITAGPDGNLWFLEQGINRIGKMNTSGWFTDYKVTGYNVQLESITTAADGNLWFTDEGQSRIGRITPAGVITFFQLAKGRGPTGIVTGADGNLWFTETDGSAIGSITLNGVVTEYPLTPGSWPTGIAAEPDGGIWFTETAANKIGLIYPPGAWSPPHSVDYPPQTVREFAIPTANSQPNGIAAGPDGNLYFTETATGKVGQITTDGVLTNELSLGRAKAGPIGVTSGTCGGWITDEKVSTLSNLWPPSPQAPVIAP